MTDAGPPEQGVDGAGEAQVTPSQLGARLVSLRAAAGLGVDDVAARTRIRGGLIRSMESGDFAPCGGAVYARGHLRSIAHVVAADGDVLVAAYDNMAGAPPPSAATVVDESTPAEPPAPVPFAALAATHDQLLPAPVQVTGRLEPGRLLPAATEGGGSRGSGPIVLPGAGRGVSERRGSPWVLAAVGVAAVILVIALGALLVPSHGQKHVVVAGKTRPTQSVSTPPTSTPVSPTTPVTLADAGVNVTVTIADNASWVHVVDATSGSVVFQGILTPGTSKVFHAAQQLKFIFGYSPSIRLVVNGHDIGTPPPNAGNDVADAVFDTTSGG